MSLFAVLPTENCDPSTGVPVSSSPSSVISWKKTRTVQLWQSGCSWLSWMRTLIFLERICWAR